MRVSNFGFGRMGMFSETRLYLQGSKLNDKGCLCQPGEWAVPCKALFIIFLAFIFQLNSLFAQNTTFTKGYQVEQRGGIVLVSNNILSCSDCDDVNQMPPGGTTDNNNRFGQYINVYPGAGIFSSSSADLTLPECSEITFAGLYWGGNLTEWNSRYAARNSVKLKLPGASEYIDINAQKSFSPYDNNYQNFADITSFVTANGSVNGTFTLANVVANTDNINLEAGWTIVIVYKNEFKPLRNLTVFHGLDGIIHGNTGELNISISGFRTPPTGPVSFELGLVAYEGDRVRNGDYLKFNNQFIADAVRGQNNVLNSSITYNGSVVTTRNPAHNNTLGYDAGVIIPDNSPIAGELNRYIQNNATGASIKVATNDDSYAIGVITTAIDIYNPHFAFTHSYVNLSSPGAPLQSSEKIRFEYELNNIGNDQSKNTVFSTQLSPLLTDVSALQVQYNNDGIWHTYTSDKDGDEAEFNIASHQLNFRLGTTANATVGGEVNPNSTMKIRFEGILTSDCELLRCSGGSFINFGTVDYDGNVNSDAHFSQQSGPLPLAGECSASGAMTVNIRIPAECTAPLPDRSFTIVCSTNVAAFSLPDEYKLYSQSDISFSSPLDEISLAGTYVARRVVGEGCDYKFNVLISLTPITAALTKVNDVVCFGSASGSLKLAVNEFSGHYNQQWLKDGSPIDTPTRLDSLPAGEYQVLVSNSCQQVLTGKVSILESNVLNVQLIRQKNVDCFGAATGALKVEASGGTPGYTYLLNNVSNTTGDFSNLNSGEYLLSVSDAIGCINTLPVVITGPAAPLSIEVVNQLSVTCFGEANGEVSVKASGGAGEYVFTLDNTTNSTGVFTGLVAGNYETTVTDAKGCVATHAVVVTQPSAALKAEVISKTDVLCFGESDGTVSVQASGGVTGYSYTLNNATNTTGVFDGLPVGTHTVNITDARGCTTNQVVVIAQPSTPLEAEVISKTDISCFGASGGSLSIQASGGIPGYKYTLKDATNTTGIFDGLPAGTHTINITDARGCTTNKVVVITQPSTLLEAEVISKTDISCFGASGGSVSIQASGGVPGYNYTLNDETNTTGVFDDLSAGPHTVIATDARGCVATLAVNITQPSAILSAKVVEKTDIVCFGETGSVSVQASGGTPEYTYKLDDISNNTGLFTGLSAGDYRIIVVDANMCTTTKTVSITQPAVALATELVNQSNVSCFGEANGSFTILASGGTGGYLYSLNGNSNSTGVFQELVSGSYSVKVTDAAGCMVTRDVTINQPSSALSVKHTIGNVTCFGARDGSVSLAVSGGAAPYKYNWSDGVDTKDRAALAAGTYNVIITDAAGCQVTEILKVNQPDSALSISYDQTDVRCFGNNNGSVDITVAGGVAPYTYLWSDGRKQEDINNLAAGFYTIQVADAAGCSVSVTIQITQPIEPLKVDLSVENALCNGTEGGKVTATVSGGLTPYKIVWDGLSSTTAAISGLSAGVYKITITDANGCTLNATTEVTTGNCPPVAVDDGYETGQEVPVTGNVSLNDFDPRDQLVFSMNSLVKYGEIQFFQDGRFIYTPNAGFTGTEIFTYQTCNTSGLCATATVTILVTPFNVVSLTPEISNVREGKKGTIKAQLLRPFETDLVITLSYSGKAQKEKDYVLLDQYLRIRIPKGRLTSTEKITVAALTDNLEEGDEDVMVQIVSTSDPVVRIGNGATVIINDIYPPDVIPVTPIKRDIPENPNLTAEPLVSPNHDGLGNEFFKIDNIISFPDNEVLIFNRWGNEVFRIKGYNESDRVFKGFANKGLATSSSPLPDGVYYFLITTNRVSEGQIISNLNKGYLILKR